MAPTHATETADTMRAIFPRRNYMMHVIPRANLFVKTV
jgi:hypothetical protein